MRRLILFFIILFIPKLSISQTNKVIDSLKIELLKEQSDSVKVIICYLLSRKYHRIDKDSANHFAYLAIKINNNRYKIEEINAYKALGVYAFTEHDYVNANLHFEKAYELSKVVNIKKEIINSAQNCIITNRRLGNYDKALEYAYVMLETSKEINDSIAITKSLFNLSKVYLALDKIEDAIQYSGEALILARIHYKKLVSDILNSLGIQNEAVGKYEKSIAYLNEAYIINKENGLDEKVAANLQNMGNTYISWGKLDLATKVLKETLELKRIIGNKENIAKTEYTLGKLEYKKENYVNSLDYINSALSYFKLSENLLDHKLIYYHRARALAKLNLHKEAYNSIMNSYEASDSLFTKEKSEIIEELQIQFETQQRKNEILELSNLNIKKESALVKSRYMNYGIIIFIIFASSIIYFYWKKRSQEYHIKLIENTIKTEEEEKIRIGKELHDNIASNILKLIHDRDAKEIQLSHKLLKVYNNVRDISHKLDNTSIHGELFMDRILETFPSNDNEKTFNLKLRPVDMEIREPHGTHIFRILQELIANNLKHSQASITKVELVLKKGVLVLEYQDNGVGIQKIDKKNGYKNISYRLTLLNGKLDLNNNVKEGFHLTIEIPYSVSQL